MTWVKNEELEPTMDMERDVNTLEHFMKIDTEK